MLGLSTAITRAKGVGRQYIKDGLKLYMPYRGDNTTKGVQFVGEGSTSFDGNDYINCGDDSDLKAIASSSFTLSAWIKPALDDSNDVIIGNTWSTKGFYFAIHSSNKLQFTILTDGSNLISTLSTNVLSAGWTHVAGTWDGTNIKTFVNGVESTNETSTGTMGSNTSTTNLYIGDNSETTKPFNGSIKNVAIWERALTATEIQNVMYKTYAEVSGRLGDSTLVSWWALDDADVYVKNTTSGTGSLTRNITSELTIGETYTVKFDVELDTATSTLVSVGTAAYGTQIYSSGYVDSFPQTSDAFTYTSGNVWIYVATPGSSIAYIKSIQVLDSNNNVVWDNFTAVGDWTTTNATLSNRYIDNKGSNHGTSGDGDPTSGTFPTHTYERYGQQSPVIPRAIDNAPTVQADAIGSGSASFDGTDDYLDGVGNCPTSAFTISCWAKKVGEGGWYAIYSAATEIWFGIGASEEVRLHVGGADRIDTAGSSVTVGTWHHISATYDGSTTGKIYIDGINQTISSSSGTLNVPDATASNIGRYSSGGDYFDGNICQVGIWDAALDQEQIQSIMEKTYEELTASEKEDLVSYWALDEQTGTDGEAGTGGVKDSHGSNHGTMYDS